MINCIQNSKEWISALRLRTLFLAVSGVVLGTGIAMHTGNFHVQTFLLTLVLAITIQILANFANDLGDFLKGTDTTGARQGPMRAVQSGNITPKQMKNAIAIMVFVVGAIGFLLILSIAASITLSAFFILLGIGFACILSALFYTVGKYAYGYEGWGDFFAFLFFGPVAVVGTCFLQVHTLTLQPVLPAVGLGFISAMILNVNNMRDMENDKASGKITVAIKLGLKHAKLYHTLLTFGTFACFLHYSFTSSPTPWYRYLYVIVFLFQFHILTQIRRKSGQALDAYLSQTAVSGFMLAVAFCICVNI